MTDTRCECCGRINKVDDVFSPSEVAIAVDDAIDLAGTVCLKLDGVSQHYPNTLPIYCRALQLRLVVVIHVVYCSSKHLLRRALANQSKGIWHAGGLFSHTRHGRLTLSKIVRVGLDEM